MALLIDRPSRAAISPLRSVCVLAALLVAGFGCGRSAGAEPRAQLDELKAAFVFQFAHFITWPESAFADESAPIVIGIVGNDDMASLLRESVRDKKVGARPVAVRVLSSPEEAAGCHIVFLDKSDDDLVNDYLALLKHQPVLTVSDDDDFTDEGGIIRLFEQQNKLRIEINVDEAERSKLTVSSKLLTLAKVVRDGR